MNPPTPTVSSVDLQPSIDSHATNTGDTGAMLNVHGIEQSQTSSVPESQPSSSNDNTQTNPLPPLMRRQPSIATLASYGIKVRDFAYESTLPPVASLIRLPHQIHNRRFIKRRREDDAPYQSSNPEGENAKRTRQLERQATEPAIDIPAGADTHIGHPNGNRRPLVRERPLRRIPTFGVPSGDTSVDRSHLSPSQSQRASQAPEPYIVTPPVTPNGTIIRRSLETITVPSSQIDNTPQGHEPTVPFSQIDNTPQGHEPGRSICPQRTAQESHTGVSPRPASPAPARGKQSRGAKQTPYTSPRYFLRSRIVAAPSPRRTRATSAISRTLSCPVPPIPSARLKLRPRQKPAPRQKGSVASPTTRGHGGWKR